VASRLSYGLTNDMPDEMLFTAAAAKRLHTRDDVLAHAMRLLAGPAGQITIRDLHEQMYRTNRYTEITRAGFKAGTGADLREEAFAFIKDIVLDRAVGLGELLTAPYTFVNSRTAPLYGLTMPAPKAAGQPDPLVRTDLDKTQRGGLFTQVGFLSSNDNATDTTPRPIMRGVHLSHDVLCAQLPAPPNVPPLPPQNTGTTNRDLIEAFTEQPGSICVSCHGKLINPLGFAFERYDQTGKFRTTDNGQLVDAKSTYDFAEGTRSYDGALELMGILAGGKQAHECYSKGLFEYLYGRDVVKDAPADQALLTEMGRRSKGTASIKAMILDLVSTDAFLNRLP
jgi:hypothetical protein